MPRPARFAATGTARLPHATQPARPARSGLAHATPRRRLPARARDSLTCTAHGTQSTQGAGTSVPGAPTPPPTKGWPLARKGCPRGQSAFITTHQNLAVYAASHGPKRHVHVPKLILMKESHSSNESMGSVHVPQASACICRTEKIEDYHAIHQPPTTYPSSPAGELHCIYYVDHPTHVYGICLKSVMSMLMQKHDHPVDVKRQALPIED